MRGAQDGSGEQAKGRWDGSMRVSCLGSKINKYGRAGRGEWLSGELSGGQAVGAWGARVSAPGCALPPAPMLALPHLLGMAGNTNLPPPGLLIALKAAETGAHALALFKGTLITLKQKQEEFTAGAQHFRFPLPLHLPLSFPAARPVCAHQLFIQCPLLND